METKTSQQNRQTDSQRERKIQSRERNTENKTSQQNRQTDSQIEREMENKT